MLHLADATRARIDRSLTGWPRGPEVRTFIAAVVWQWANGAHDSSPDSAAVEDAAVTRVVGLIEAASGGAVTFEGGVDALANDPVLLSAFFQNLDLLPAEHDPQVDAIAMMVGDAVYRLSRTFESGPDSV